MISSGFLIFFTICIFSGTSYNYERSQIRWFPAPPGQEDNNKSIEYESKEHVEDDQPKMGVPSSCDDAKTNLTVDWDNSPINYTCFENKNEYLPDLNVHPLLSTEYIPKQYVALHTCMDTPISYDRDLPTYGTHRSLWPKYGEYRFVPLQRWLHSLEHGAVVMLYHPCANHNEVNLLRTLVQNCLFRHIITPYNLLQPSHPLVLLTWGHKFEMSKVNPKLVLDFIKKNALRGPEKNSVDGQYNYEHISDALIVSDDKDSVVCPDVYGQSMR